MLIVTTRFLLRDFVARDRVAFLAYQSDPRYRALYDIAEGDESHASRIFARCLAWQEEDPRRRFQLGVFERSTGALCGCAGLRLRPAQPGTAELGIELAPDAWGRYRMAVEVATGLVDFGFGPLRLERILGDTASGNERAARLARWLGAEATDQRPGPAWMAARGWHEVTWTISRERWEMGRGSWPVPPPGQ